VTGTSANRFNDLMTERGMYAIPSGAENSITPTKNRLIVSLYMTIDSMYHEFFGQSYY
jgi:hypothetical protein